MDISSTNALGSMTGIIQRNSNADANGFSSSSSTSTGFNQIEQMNISPFGKMASNMSGLSADERAQARSFRDEMRSAMKGGGFDPEEMAQKAPDFMKERAEANGVSLTDVFQQIEDRVSSLRNLGANGFGLMQGNNVASNNQLLESLMASLSGDKQES